MTADAHHDALADGDRPGRGSGGAAADGAALERALGHRFRSRELLRDALTHPSMAGSWRGELVRCGTPYERLEFLGDRVLGLVIAEWLLERHPTEREGDLARRHVALVRRQALARVAADIDLGAHLLLSPGEDEQGGRANPAILADACEALVGALYLDAGLDTVRAFIRRHWAAILEAGGGPPRDPKTALQEWAQARGKPLPSYDTIGRSGPAHEPVFQVRVQVEGLEPATGEGPSKRAAEKAAARALLRLVGESVDDHE